MKRLLILLISSIIITLTSNAQVEISGIAKNYTDTIFYISEPGGFNNFTRAWRDNRVKVAIDKNGHFKATIPERAINTWYIKTEKGNQFFDLVKGKNIELVADFSQPQPLLAVNDNADEFNYYSYSSDSIREYYSDNNLQDKIQNRNIDSVLFYRKGLANFNLNFLNNYKKTHKVSDIYYKWLNSQYTYEPYERALEENISNKDFVDDKTLQKIMEKGIHDEYAALNTTAYNDLIDFYIRTKYRNKFNEKVSFDESFSFVADSDLITGNTKDVFLSRFMYSLRRIPDSQYSPIFKKYNRIVSNKEMKQSVIDARSDYENPPVSKMSDFYRAKSLEEVLKKYKGKVIYIDFWASWCMPCLGEMPNAAALKEKLKGKDIVFLYFGYKDKERAWTKARNKLSIEGEHVLLNEQLIKEADEVFGVNGIPHYAIIDKEGNIVSKRANRPNEVYQQLLKQIEK